MSGRRSWSRRPSTSNDPAHGPAEIEQTLAAATAAFGELA